MNSPHVPAGAASSLSSRVTGPDHIYTSPHGRPNAATASSMSVTTTTNARVISVRHILQDYDLHHSTSQPSEADAAAAPPTNETREPAATNPIGWQDQWRRVPDFRPVQNQVDAQRNTYTSEIERHIVRTMLGGVWLLATGSRVWRATTKSDCLDAAIGGEW